MSFDERFPKRYDPKTTESRWQAHWANTQMYRYDANSTAPTFSIDTPPPTISGRLHIGHVFSYTHTEIISRYRRMQGFNVYYPFGYDDNGLPTELLAEKESGLRAHQTDRRAFRELCLTTGKKYSSLYASLWKRLGFSCDFETSYSTISLESQRISQWSFVDLYNKGHIERRREPALWCTKCVTSFAQAEIEDQPMSGSYVHISFTVPGQNPLVIATTRPEMLSACVAIFAHPDDERYQAYFGKKAIVPLSGQEVPILPDDKALASKGTGSVMCCTFGDATDIYWWRKHQLPLREILSKTGKMLELAGPLAGLSLKEAKIKIVELLNDKQLVVKKVDIAAEDRAVNTHERCGTPVEFILQPQWFIKLCDKKEALIAAGRKVTWHPEFMRYRYENWVENLSWDWAISRQRAFGVPIPAWISSVGNHVCIADPAQLPLDPTETKPSVACPEGEWVADSDVMDTWATSSVTPLINAAHGSPDERKNFLPMSMRPQAHDIIRTWAFYTIAKSSLHFSDIPWKEIVVSGHVKKPSAPEVSGSKLQGQDFVKKTKISKSKDGDTFAPEKIMERHSSDAIRLWSAGASLGTDILFDEGGMADADKFLNKLWNASRFALMQLEGFTPSANHKTVHGEDHWIRGRLKETLAHYVKSMNAYETHLAKIELDKFFWLQLCDNYIEFVKCRLQSSDAEGALGSKQTVYDIVLTILKLYAPFAPHISEEIYQNAFREFEKAESLHQLKLPELCSLSDAETSALRASDFWLSAIAAIRLGKSKRHLGFKVPAKSLYVQSSEQGLQELKEFLPVLQNFSSAKSVIAGVDVLQNRELWETNRADLALSLEIEVVDAT